MMQKSTNKRCKILNNHSLLDNLRIFEQIKLAAKLQDAETDLGFMTENPKSGAMHSNCNYALSL